MEKIEFIDRKMSRATTKIRLRGKKFSREREHPEFGLGSSIAIFWVLFQSCKNIRIMNSTTTVSQSSKLKEDIFGSVS